MEYAVQVSNMQYSDLFENYRMTSFVLLRTTEESPNLIAPIESINLVLDKNENT